MAKKLWESKKQYSIVADLVCSRLTKEQDVLVIGTGPFPVNSQMTGQARTLTICDADMESIGRLQGTIFDVIFIHDLLHTVKNPEVLLQAVHGLIKPQGMLIAPTFIFFSKWELNHQIKKAYIKMKGGTQYETFSGLYYESFIENHDFHIIQSGTITGLVPIRYIVAIDTKSEKNWTRNKNTRRPKIWNQKMYGINMRKTS